MKKAAPRPTPAPRPQNVYYTNCKDVWNQLGRPITARDAGFSGRFDRDGDGIGCESRPKY
ncbi:excalibur calcium-binding domain-containing protein [uncultured Corynebacterium sp.]|uniref:excalibur calcium-binding domain-containing protein n=1 Tax=uncultured Corynebacterium sp. TaxID=159447 RepID=UPI0025F610F3|nr:excalibur calcium-binding domain-containing protein [uncultured Corynebacterium sp.]